MGKRMYYTEEEAAGQLGVTVDELNTYVRDERLRVFHDGPRKMFKVDEVDALAGGEAEEEITLSPADSVDLTLAETGGPAAGPRDETVITAEGISIFDEEELGINVADPMAATQITEGLAAEPSLESTGGLMDLTQESDDTGVGVGLADLPEGDEEPPIGGIQEPSFPSQTGILEAPGMVTEGGGGGAFGGLAVAGTLMMLLLGAVAMAVMLDLQPGFFSMLSGNLMYVTIGGVVLILVCAVLGALLGRSPGPGQT